MYAAIVKALNDTNGPDISGKVVPMPTGSYHLVSKASLPFFNSHPDVFQVTYEADDADPALLSTVNGNTVLRGADGAGVLRGPMVSAAWFTSPSVFRLRLTGTGSVQFDSRDSAGTVTVVATYTLSGATDQIEFPYAGDNAVAIRATFSGDITVEVL
jgi:hypothetical protein